jgi:hypothetical protein
VQPYRRQHSGQEETVGASQNSISTWLESTSSPLLEQSSSESADLYKHLYLPLATAPVLLLLQEIYDAVVVFGAGCAASSEGVLCRGDVCNPGVWEYGYPWTQMCPKQYIDMFV